MSIILLWLLTLFLFINNNNNNSTCTARYVSLYIVPIKTIWLQYIYMYIYSVYIYSVHIWIASKHHHNLPSALSTFFLRLLFKLNPKLPYYWSYPINDASPSFQGSLLTHKFLWNVLYSLLNSFPLSIIVVLPSTQIALWPKEL